MTGRRVSLSTRRGALTMIVIVVVVVIVKTIVVGGGGSVVETTTAAVIEVIRESASGLVHFDGSGSGVLITSRRSPVEGATSARSRRLILFEELLQDHIVSVDQNRNGKASKNHEGDEWRLADLHFPANIDRVFGIYPTVAERRNGMFSNPLVFAILCSLQGADFRPLRLVQDASLAGIAVAELGVHRVAGTTGDVAEAVRDRLDAFTAGGAGTRAGTAGGAR